MMNEREAYQTIVEAAATLHAGGVIDPPLELTPDTILLGSGSPLDSMALVALIAELEERLSRAAGREIFLLFDEIHAFNESGSALPARTLARFITTLPDSGT